MKPGAFPEKCINQTYIAFESNSISPIKMTETPIVKEITFFRLDEDFIRFQVS